MTKLVIPKGMVIFPGAIEGVATENIHVAFDGSPDEVAAVLCQNNQKDLLPQLEHEDGDKLIRYTRQGNRIETAIPPKSAPKQPSAEIPADKKPAKEPAKEPTKDEELAKAPEADAPTDKTEAAADTKPATSEVKTDSPATPEIIKTPEPVKAAPKSKKRVNPKKAETNK